MSKLDEIKPITYNLNLLVVVNEITKVVRDRCGKNQVQPERPVDVIQEIVKSRQLDDSIVLDICGGC